MNEFKPHDYFKADDQGYISRKVFIEHVRNSYDHMRELATLIKGYDQTIDSYLERWDQNLESLDDSIIGLLKEWIDDSTFATIINEEIFKTKADQVDLENVTAQLQQTEYEATRKRELEDLSPTVLSAIEGGEGTSFNLLTIPQDDSVSWKKTDFVKIGKNLFNKMKAIPEKRVSSSNGNLYDASSFYASEYIEVTPNQLYSRTNAQDSAGYDENFNYVEGYSNTDTFTTGSNVVYVRLSVHIDRLNKFQFEAGERTPFKEFGYKLPLELPPIDEKNIEDETIGFNKTSFIQRGKNLFNKNNVTQGYYPSSNNGELVVNASFSTSEYIPVKPNTSYKKKLESHYAIYDNNKEFVKGGMSSVIETEKDSRYVRIGVNNKNLETEQLEEGTVSTAYEDYYLTIPDLKNGQSQVLDNIVEVGSGKQYATITSALNAITDASATNVYNIIVHEGLYLETFHTKNHVNIIGENPNKCIIRYEAPNIDNWTNESTIFAETTTLLKNLTIRTLNTKYPVHSDAPTGDYTLTIDNCILVHEGSTNPERTTGTPMGIGAYPNQNFIIVDSHFIGYNPENSGASGINYHNLGNNSGLGYRYLKVKNTIIENVRHAVLITTLDNSEGQENDVFLHNNVLNGESNAYLVSDAYSDYNSYRLHLVNNTRNGQYVE